MDSLRTDGACLAKVRATLPNDSDAAQRIGRFILASPGQAMNMPINELASACGTSAGTVSRYCRSLGYASYKECQLDLAAALAQVDSVIPENFGDSWPPDAVISGVFECNRRSLTETEQLLDHNTLIEVARLIQGARRSLFLGIGGSGLTATWAAERLMNLGLPAFAVVDPTHQISVTGAVGRSDVVVGISATGQTTCIVEAMQTARRRGARTVAVTNHLQSPLAAASEFQLATALISSSLVAQVSVMDALYFVLNSWGGTTARSAAEDIQARLQTVCRPAAPDQRDQP